MQNKLGFKSFLILLMGLTGCHMKTLPMVAKFDGKIECLGEKTKASLQVRGELLLFLTVKDGEKMREQVLELGDVSSDANGQFTSEVRTRLLVTKALWERLDKVNIVDYDLVLLIDRVVQVLGQAIPNKPSYTQLVENPELVKSLQFSFAIEKSSIETNAAISKSEDLSHLYERDRALVRFYDENHSSLNVRDIARLFKHIYDRERLNFIFADYVEREMNRLTLDDFIFLMKNYPINLVRPKQNGPYEDLIVLFAEKNVHLSASDYFRLSEIWQSEKTHQKVIEIALQRK